MQYYTHAVKIKKLTNRNMNARFKQIQVGPGEGRGVVDSQNDLAY